MTPVQGKPVRSEPVWRGPVRSEAEARVRAEIDRLDLGRYADELEEEGVTVVPPDRVGGPARADELLEVVLDLMERRNGVRPDVASGTTHVNVCFPTLYYVLFEDERFQTWLLDPVMLALVDFLLGEQCLLHTTTLFMKGPTDPPESGLQLGLHSDQQMVPEPFPSYALIAGATLLLTDYSRDEGAFAYVPGSHREGRHPLPGEGVDRVVPIDAPKGSLLVHHGALWHGSFGKTTPGLRAGLAYAFCRMFMTPMEAYGEQVTPELLARHPARFARLLGQSLPIRTTEAGPDLLSVATSVARSPFD